jgi:hypothetical protein
MGLPYVRQVINVRAPVLVNRGWISKGFAQRSSRPASVDPGTTIIKGLSLLLWWFELIVVRSPPKSNIFTPENDFGHGKFYYVNVPQMAEYTGSEPLLIEQTFGTISISLTSRHYLCLLIVLYFDINDRGWPDRCWKVGRARSSNRSLPRDNPSKCTFSIYRNMVSSWLMISDCKGTH